MSNAIATKTTDKVTFIDVPTPKMGGKAWVLDAPGIYVLAVGEGVLRTTACTHFGSGNMAIYDGVPTDEGFFPEADSDAPERNGRTLIKWNPAVMGSWMLDAGFIHGLTVEVAGGHNAISPIATIVWMPRLR